MLGPARSPWGETGVSAAGGPQDKTPRQDAKTRRQASSPTQQRPTRPMPKRVFNPTQGVVGVICLSDDAAGHPSRLAPSSQPQKRGRERRERRCSKDARESGLPEPAPSWVANRVVIPAARSMLESCVFVWVATMNDDDIRVSTGRQTLLRPLPVSTIRSARHTRVNIHAPFEHGAAECCM